MTIVKEYNYSTDQQRSIRAELLRFLGNIDVQNGMEQVPHMDISRLIALIFGLSGESPRIPLPTNHDDTDKINATEMDNLLVSQR